MAWREDFVSALGTHTWTVYWKDLSTPFKKLHKSNAHRMCGKRGSWPCYDKAFIPALSATNFPCRASKMHEIRRLTWVQAACRGLVLQQAALLSLPTISEQPTRRIASALPQCKRCLPALCIPNRYQTVMPSRQYLQVCKQWGEGLCRQGNSSGKKNKQTLPLFQSA